MKQRQYIDFKLYLTRAVSEEGAIQVALLPTPEVGETILPVTVSAEQGPQSDQLGWLAAKQITLRNLIAYGKGLANWLLPEEGNIRQMFLRALDQARNEGGVRLRLIIADHRLKQLPWEYVYLNRPGDPDSLKGFLALNPLISIVRHEPLDQRHPVIAKSDTENKELRMVIAGASPEANHLPPLNIDIEIKAIQQALQNFAIDGVKMLLEPALQEVTFAEIQQKLQGVGSADVFHFAGHGISQAVADPANRGGEKEEGFLYFIGDKAKKSEEKVRASAVAALLQRANVRLAVFSACLSAKRNERYPWDGVAGALVANSIPAVVAMQFELYDAQSLPFCEAFYAALASGLSLDEATAAGRLAMYHDLNLTLDDVVNVEWGIPVLYHRLADGILFPAKAEKAGAAAELFRKVIQQTIDTIDTTGQVTGIIAKRVKSSFMLAQSAKVVEGKLVGIDVDSLDDSASIRIEQTADTVSGTMIGAVIDEF